MATTTRCLAGLFQYRANSWRQYEYPHRDTQRLKPVSEISAWRARERSRQSGIIAGSMRRMGLVNFLHQYTARPVVSYLAKSMRTKTPKIASAVNTCRSIYFSFSACWCANGQAALTGISVNARRIRRKQSRLHRPYCLSPGRFRHLCGWRQWPALRLALFLVYDRGRNGGDRK